MRKFLPAFGILAILLSLNSSALAQRIVPRGLPLPMTMTLQKPAPDEVFGDRKTIDLGVGAKTYKFVLRDLYVDDPEGKIVGPDVLRATENYKPNIQVQGLNNDQLAKMQPGETVTFQGIYAPLTRTFEIAEIRPGPGPVSPPKSY